MDKPTVNQQLLESGILSGISLNRVAKKIRGDVLALLAQLRDQLTGKLNSDAVMTDFARQRATDLLKFSQATIDRSYAEIGKKTRIEPGRAQHPVCYEDFGCPNKASTGVRG